jgi:hypothetical protein
MAVVRETEEEKAEKQAQKRRQQADKEERKRQDWYSKFWEELGVACRPSSSSIRRRRSRLPIQHRRDESTGDHRGDDR